MPTITPTVAASGDDWFVEFDGSGAFDNTNTTNYVGYLNSGDYYQSGFRFTGVTVPQGATITAASITAKAFAVPAGTLPFSFSIFGVGANNAAAPTSYATHAALARTTANVTWTPTVWTTGTVYTSPDISSVVQEITNRAGWVSGNALILLFQQPAVFAANGSLRISSYDTAPSAAATLSTTYSTGVAPTYTEASSNDATLPYYYYE